MASDTGSAPAEDERAGAGRWTPRLRVVLLAVNLVILTLPLGGVALLRLYETTLLRHTESELIVQGAVVAAAYQQRLAWELEQRAQPPAAYGGPLDPRHLPVDDDIQPLAPSLDRAVDPILPPARDGTPAPAPADEAARAAGRWVGPVLVQAQRTTLAGMRVVDPQGVVVATTRGEEGLSLAHREEIQRALRGERVRVMRQRISDEPSPPLESVSRGTRVRVHVALPIIAHGRVHGAVLLSRTPLDVTKALYTIRGYLMLAAVALLLVVALVSLFTSVTIGRPVRALIAQTERVRRGERGAARPLERPVTHEVAQLSEAIAAMARALEERADYISTFAANVSHEFKTPLTSIRGTVELLRDHLEDMTPQERDRFLGNLEGDAERLGRLVQRLLELARADVLKPGDEHIEAGAVARQVAARVGDAQRRVEVEVRREGRVTMGRETLESILGNLIDNALQHGGPDTRVQVAVEAVGGMVRLQVIDDGPGISEANLGRVFDRFFTTARARGGSGLGLSIVKALVEAHGGSVALTSRPGHTAFTLELPAAFEP